MNPQDEEAILAMLSEHREALYLSACTLYRGKGAVKARADDLTHDTLIRAASAISRGAYKEEDVLVAWLQRIMLNLYRSQYRKEKKMRAILHGIHEEGGRSANPSPLDIAQARQLMGVLKAHLPQGHYAVLELSHVWDLRKKAIAAELEIPLGTVMSRLHRARLMARAVIEDIYNADQDEVLLDET